MELEFNISNQSLKRIDNSQPADLSNEYLTCRFNFKSDDWSGFGKFAIFRVGEMSYRELIIEDECVVPFDVLKHNKFLLTVYGVKDDIRITTNYLWVHLNASAFVTNYDESSYFNPDMTEELLELVELKTDKSLFDETVTELESSIATKTDNTTFTDTVNDLENSIDTKTLPTLYLNQTLRSGQTVNYEGNILIVGDAHPGSEIVADGDITVWGILGGIAHAGAKGNITSKVRALKLNAIQLRIAGLYARRNDTLNVPYVQKTNEFTPEEAQIEEGKIVIYKKLRRD